MENNSKSKNPYKTIMIILIVIAVLLLAVLTYIWIDRSGMIKELQVEKTELTNDMISLQTDYATLSSNNDSLTVQIDREKIKVDQLIKRVKRTEATNRTEIRKYKRELGTLRSIMKHYIVQIDSLNTLNIQLKQDAVLARKEAKNSKEKYNQLSKTTDEYAKTIETGAIIKGRAINVVALNHRNKETTRSSRTIKLKTSVTLIENSITKKGLRTIYIRVKGPDGILISESQEQIFNIEGENMIYSDSREIDYQGDEIDMSIYFQIPEFQKGVYTIDIYTTESKLGSCDINLR
ncbi:MAG: hypothetical protein WC140_02515 [Bacteroidales bacterium]